jgi:hypothetical protein
MVMEFGATARGLAQAFMKAAAAEGATAIDTITQLRNAGLGYRYQDFLQDFQQYAWAQVQHDNLRHVPDQYRPALSNYAINNYGHPGGTFTYVVEIDRHNTSTGERETVYRNIVSDTELTAGDIKSDAYDMMQNEGMYPDTDVDSVNLYEAWATPDAFE